jgi:recombination protein RecT
MAEKNQEIVKVMRTPNDLKVFLHKNYFAQIKNFFEDEKQALKFMSSVMADVQKTPKLMECEGTSLINSYMTMAQLGLMPSGVSGEAYVLPYNNKNGMIAQFQLGYQGLLTLFFRAGGQSVRAEIVRANDFFSYENGIIKHKIDIFKSNEERGEVIGAYAIAVVNGQEISKAMNKADIYDMGKRYSKSYSTSFTPWKEANDPEGWMLKKTVLKQLGKLMPKNETIYKAIAADNEDGNMNQLGGAVDNSGLQMKNFLKEPENNEEPKTKEPKNKSSKENEEKFPVINADTGEEVSESGK